jgi:DNA invertase Pin-like site-specific DNA recombinase
MSVPAATRPRAYSYVRMSTDVQLRGDSLRRQLDQSRDYAARQGWDLLEEDQLRDVGISAFSGANVSGGALGQFLEAIRTRKVEPGSFLIVESLDRLSRQEILKSLGLFIEIINAGVNIVTLADGRTYTDATGFEDLIFSIVSMSRAHDESRTKSHRLSAAWSNKRKNAETRKLTAQCPGWLKLSRNKKEFEVIKERADVVVSIFEESAGGIGNYSITRRLNQAGVPAFGRSKGWRSSSVAKILANRSVLGEFQPHRLDKGKRIPAGDVIRDYFPAIVDEQLFYRAQNARGQRRVKGGGRKGSNISNLFSGLATCAYCKSKMRFENKGPGPKGGTYLVCDAARRGLHCEKTAWRYDQLEASFLAFVKEIDLESLMRSEAETKQRAELDNNIAALKGRLGSVQEQRERTYGLFLESTLASGFVSQKLNELEQQRVELENAIQEKEKERVALSSDLSEFYESKEQIKALIERLQKSQGDEIYKLRSQIASRLKSLVSTVLVASVGSAPLTRNVINFLKNNHDSEATNVISHLSERLSDERENRRWFAIGFKDGSTRAVYPTEHDPLQFEEQVIASKDEGMIKIHPKFREAIFLPNPTQLFEESLRAEGEEEPSR